MTDENTKRSCLSEEPESNLPNVLFSVPDVLWFDYSRPWIHFWKPYDSMSEIVKHAVSPLVHCINIFQSVAYALDNLSKNKKDLVRPYLGLALFESITTLLTPVVLLTMPLRFTAHYGRHINENTKGGQSVGQLLRNL